MNYEQIIAELERLLQPLPDWNDPTKCQNLSRQVDNLFGELRSYPRGEQSKIEALKAQYKRRRSNQPAATMHRGTATAPSSVDLQPIPFAAPPPSPSLSPPSDPFSESLDPTGASQQVLHSIQARFDIKKKLGTGRYSTGYEANNKDTGQRVIVKLPSERGWLTEFDDCARALRKEADILGEVNRLFDAGTFTSGRGGTARVIQQIGCDDVRVSPEIWEHPIPCSIQSFARGTRLSEAGFLPLRGTRERTGILILAQLISLVQQLYQHNISHRDIKPDALFWDEEDGLLEVIDWNLAVRNPTDDQKQHEFTLNIRDSVTEILLGARAERFVQTADGGVARVLFSTAQHEALSRGTRLVIARLLDERLLHNALRTVADLHVAIQELANFWLNDMTAMPQVVGTTPEKLSSLLSQVAIERHKPAADSASPSQREEWYRQIVERVQKEVQSQIAEWIVHPASMRPGKLRMDTLWCWLPDVWPLGSMMPLVEAWFASQPRERDADLALLIQHILKRQWMAIETMIAGITAPGTESLLPFLTHVRDRARAYRDLEQAEELMQAAHPDYVGAFRLLGSVQKELSSEPRVELLRRQIIADSDERTEIERLRQELTACRATPPSLSMQRKMTEILRRLQNSGYPDDRHDEHTHIMKQIDMAAQALVSAQDCINHREWRTAREALTAWQGNAVVRQHAPDLAAAIDVVYEQTSGRAIIAPFEDTYMLVEQALREDNLVGALDAAEHVWTLAKQDSSIPRHAHEEMQRLVEALRAACNLDQLISEGKYQQANKVPVPTVRLVALKNKLTFLQEFARHRGELEALIQPQQGEKMMNQDRIQNLSQQWKSAQRRLTQQLSSAERKMMEESLHTARASLEQALTEAAEAETLTEQELSYCRSIVETLAEADKKNGVENVSLRYVQARLEKQEEHLHTQKLHTESEEVKQQVVGFQGAVDDLNKRSSEHSQWIEYFRGQDIGTLRDTLQGLAQRVGRIESSQQERGSTPSQPGGVRDISPGTPPVRSDMKMVVMAGVGIVLLVVIVLGGLLIREQRKQIAALSSPTPTLVLVTSTPTATDATVTTTSSSVAMGVTPALTDTTTLTPTTTPVVSDTLTEPTPSPGVVAETSTTPSVVTETPSDTTPSPGVVAELPMPFTINAAIGRDRVSSIQVKIGEEIVSSNIKVIASSDPTNLTVELPANLLSTVKTDVTLPLDSALVIGLDKEGQQVVAVPITLGSNEGIKVTVRGAVEENLVQVAKDQDLFAHDGGMLGARLWKTADTTKRTRADDAVKPKGDVGLLVLNNGDFVQILGMSQGHYRVRVVTNQFSKDVKTVIGQEGWILKALVDGQ